MPVTRSAARKAGESPEPKSSSHVGGRRKASQDSSLASEPPKKSLKKNAENGHQSPEAQDGAVRARDEETEVDHDEEVRDGSDATKDVEMKVKHQSNAQNGNGSTESQEGLKNELGDAEAEPGDLKDEFGDTNTSGSNRSTIQKSVERGSEMPSNIVEKGLVYFLTRSRVDTEDPRGVADLQRSYIALRPLTKDAKLGDGPIPEAKASRLIAIPKKTLPKSRRDRFMVFVEKSKASTKELKDTFFEGNEYETQTKGTRHTQPITPVGEGVYAITTTGRTSHLVYILAIPSEPGQVQKDMGIHRKGSFVLSLKNPTTGGPPWATLSEKPSFPQSILDDFRGLKWMPIQKPEYLDYPNSQLLLIGESQDNLGGAAAPTEEDQKSGDKETPEKELERLEGEKEVRIEHLHGDDSIFDDLHTSKKEYPNVLSTW
jgi:hypothetical protein